LALFAGVDQRESALGAATVDIVVEQLNTNSFGLPPVPKTVMIECAWRDGPSIRGRQEVVPTTTHSPRRVWATAITLTHGFKRKLDRERGAPTMTVAVHQ
jgi:hypothetical protein